MADGTGQLRQSPSGDYIEGDPDAAEATPGQVILIWNPAESRWESRTLAPSGTVLAPGTVDHQPLVWDEGTETWIPATLIVVNLINDFNGNGITVSADGKIDIRGLPILLGSSDGTNGAVRCDRQGVAEAARAGFLDAEPVERQSVEGATTQDQLDSLIAGLVLLGFVTDNR